MNDYNVARIDEIEGVDYRQQTRMHPVRHHLGITAFGTNAWTAEKVGDRMFPSTRRTRATRSSTSSCGVGRGSSGEDKVDAPAGTLVFVSPETTRTAFAEEAGTAVLAVGATRGKAYEPSGWEAGRRRTPVRGGRYTGAVERGRKVVEANPRVRRADVQPRLLRGAGGDDEGLDRAPARRHRDATQPPRAREGGHRLRLDPGRARLPRARQGLTATAAPPPARLARSALRKRRCFQRLFLWSVPG